MFPSQVDEAEMFDAKHNKTGHREITTHMSIHTLHLDGLRELYRHFLRLPDGAIVEVCYIINHRSKGKSHVYLIRDVPFDLWWGLITEESIATNRLSIPDP